MALRDWLSDSGRTANANAAKVSKKHPKKARSLAALATLAVADSELPPGCPLCGGPVPTGCRFNPRLFSRMIREGVLPMPDGSCPIRRVCKMTLTP